MRSRRGMLLTAALLLLAAAAAGCGRSSLRIGWLESGGPGHRTARYRSFSGVEQASFRAQAGEEIELEYDVEVERGTLGLALVGPNGETLWDEQFDEAAEDTVRVMASESGRHRLRIEGDSTRGSFDLRWSADDG